MNLEPVAASCEGEAALAEIRRARASGLRPDPLPLCRECGEPFNYRLSVRPLEVRFDGHKRTFCGPRCADEYKRKGDIARKAAGRNDCPGCGGVKAGGSRLCRACNTPRSQAQCPQCGSEYWPWANKSRRLKHCSRKCARDAQRVVRVDTTAPLVAHAAPYCNWSKGNRAAGAIGSLLSTTYSGWNRTKNGPCSLDGKY